MASGQKAVLVAYRDEEGGTMLFHVEGKRVRGMGPHGVKVGGGSGRSAPMDGGAVAWEVHPGLTSAPRLRLLSYLERESWRRGPEAARALELPLTTTHEALHGMFDTYLVEKRTAPMVWGYSRGKTGGVYALEWRVSDYGARCVDGLVRKTLELLPFMELERLASIEKDAVDGALARDLQTALMRPARMAIAYHLLWIQPSWDSGLAQALRIRRTTAACALQDFARRGWVSTRPARFDGYQRFGYVRARAARYGFTQEGREALERHVWAVAGVRLWEG